MSLLFFPEGIRCKNETKDLIWTNEMFNDSATYTYVNHIVSNVNFIQIDKSWNDLGFIQQISVKWK